MQVSNLTIAALNLRFSFYSVLLKENVVNSLINNDSKGLGSKWRWITALAQNISIIAEKVVNSKLLPVLRYRRQHDEKIPTYLKGQTHSP